MSLSLHISLRKNLNLFATNRCNKMCFLCQITGMTALMTYFLCNLLEKCYVVFIISWHCSLGGNFLADALRYLSWPALSRSWHLAASGMGLGVMSHQAGLLTTLHHIHICFPEQGARGGTRSGFIRGCAAPGSEPLPYFRESRTPKTYPILGKYHNPGHPKRSGLQKHTLF